MNEERDENGPELDPILDPEIDVELRRLAAEEALEPVEGGHVDPIDLAAYRDGRLPEARAASIRAHLLACRECGDLLLDLETWVRGDFGNDLAPPSEFEIAAAWKGVREAGREGAAFAPPRALPVRPAVAAPTPSSRWRRAPLALAAAGLIAAIGLSVQNAALRREVAGLSAPTINAPVADLSVTPERGAAYEPIVVSVPPGAAVFTVVLAPPGTASAGTVAVEILVEGKNSTSSGRVLWRGEGLMPNGGESYTLTIPLRALGGERRIAIRLLDPADRHPIAVYHLNIVNL